MDTYDGIVAASADSSILVSTPRAPLSWPKMFTFSRKLNRRQIKKAMKKVGIYTPDNLRYILGFMISLDRQSRYEGMAKLVTDPSRFVGNVPDGYQPWYGV